MTDKPTEPPKERELTPQELKKIEAEAAREEAEALRIQAETRKLEAETAVAVELKNESAAKSKFANAQATLADINAEREQIKRTREIYSDDYNEHVYRFLRDVRPDSAQACINQLRAWARQDPGCDLTIMFDSPGGDVVAGMHLFDELRALSAEGHKLTTKTRGMAASMAGILLQAGDNRIMGPESWILIHEISFGTSGSMGEVDDRVKWLKKIQERVLDIFAARCKGANKKNAKRALTRAALKRGWTRKDWWIDSDSALAFGLVDEIG